MSTVVDVAIVGAGVHGAAAAFHLAERDVSVAVLERGLPACGPTGRSSAVLRGYYVNEFLARATHESMELFRDFSARTGGEASFVACGALFLHAEEDGPKVQRVVDGLRRIGIDAEILDAAAIAPAFPHFALDGIGLGVWEPNAGHADPAGTTKGLLDAALRRGASLLTGAEVVAIEPGPHGVRVTAADGRTVEAGELLLCAGPWTANLLDLVGVALPLWAERHIIATFGWGQAPHLPFVWASVPDGIYVKPELHAQYLVGTLWEEPRTDPNAFAEELSPDEQLRITSALVSRAPALGDSEARSGYAALYDVSPDWQPVIGTVTERVHVLAGTAGHGFKWAPAMGRHLADLVTGEVTDPGLAQFHPSRFAEGIALDAGFGEARILG